MEHHAAHLIARFGHPSTSAVLGAVTRNVAYVRWCYPRRPRQFVDPPMPITRSTPPYLLLAHRSYSIGALRATDYGIHTHTQG